jgi:hypothetical protein
VITAVRKYNNLYLKIALSAAVLALSAQAAALFKSANIWTTWGIICVIFASVAFATLLFITNYIHAVILCPAGIIVEAVVSLDLLSVLWSAAYIPMGWIIYHGVAKKITRTLITVRISAFLVIFYAALIIGSLSALHNNISPEIIYQAADEQIQSAVADYEDLFDMYIPYDIEEEERKELRELLMQDFAMRLKMMVPMLFIFYCMTAAYLITSLFRILYNVLIGTKVKSRALKRMEWRLKLSAASAVILILSAVFNLLLFDPYNQLPSIIISNIQYILVPGFCVMGIYFLFDKIYYIYNRDKRLKSGVVPAVMLILACGFAVLFFQNMGFAVLTIFGLYAALIGDIKKFYEKTKKRLFGDDDEEI